MSEHLPSRGRHNELAIDRLLAESRLDGDADLRTELLELRSLASTAPLPSDAVRALMVGGPAAVTQQTTTAEALVAPSGASTAVLATADLAEAQAPVGGPAVVDELAAVDEIAARRRKKRRTAIAGLAVVVSLAGGATAAAASEGGIPGAFQHLGAAIGSVVSQLAPGSGNAPQQGGPVGPAPAPPADETPAPPVRNQPGPAPSTPGALDRVPQPGGAAPSQAPKGPQHDEPGKRVIPTPPVVPVTPPAIDTPTIDPSKIRPSEIPVPVPTHVVPDVPGKP
ncbi:hypothetical protein LN996_19955 [Arthrobacter sp. AK01]|uniref:hypothetical protein n=1 Tax=Micrococcaceae TaxID=1268 RepID=UPI001E5B7593|nr:MULTISPECIES: hypothetical protein [Micrococcaceae]MCD4853099.1 hypothetical protein [Arthrobacter sp. AK01]MCP1411258.1 hypothetical protein [Paenarthrobacter sp. A20]